MTDVVLEKNWSNNELLCPVCDGNNLHHEAVTAYNRQEDAEIVRVTNVDGSQFTSLLLPNKTSGNPSGRRDGIVIEFWCENCHATAGEGVLQSTPLYRLQIQQHKGTTYLDWDIPKN